MKKTVTDKNGNVTEIEGTAEELAEFERKLNEVGSSSKETGNKKLLKDVRQILSEELANDRALRPAPISVQPWIQPWDQTVKPFNTWTGSSVDVPCMIQEFMRNNPNHQGPLMLSCPCPRCTPQCTIPASYAWPSQGINTNTMVCALN